MDNIKINISKNDIYDAGSYLADAVRPYLLTQFANILKQKSNAELNDLIAAIQNPSSTSEYIVEESLRLSEKNYKDLASLFQTILLEYFGDIVFASEILKMVEEFNFSSSTLNDLSGQIHTLSLVKEQEENDAIGYY